MLAPILFHCWLAGLRLGANEICRPFGRPGRGVISPLRRLMGDGSLLARPRRLAEARIRLERASNRGRRGRSLLFCPRWLGPGN